VTAWAQSKAAADGLLSILVWSTTSGGNQYVQFGSRENPTVSYQPLLVYQSAAPMLDYWRHQYFGTYDNTGIAADASVANSDGVPNLLEYATGRNPVGNNPGAPFKFGITTDGTRLSLTFNSIADPVLTYSVDASADLSTWTSIWSSTGTSNAGGSVTVPDTVPVSNGPRRYLRLRVTVP